MDQNSASYLPVLSGKGMSFQSHLEARLTLAGRKMKESRNSSSSRLVSIIISNYNGGEIFRECLDSLMRLNYPRYEIIVVDAGSSDGSPQMIKERFPKVNLIEEERIGIGEAINIGLRRARGEIVIFDYNSDEIAHSEWLSQIVEVLTSSRKIGVVGGTRILYGTAGIVDDAGLKISFLGHSTKLCKGKNYSDMMKDPREVDCVTCIGTRRDVIDKVGLVDDEYEIYGEDADFCIRVKKAGYEIINVPSAITYHKESASVGKETPRYVYFLQRAMMRTILKHSGIDRMVIGLMWTMLLTLGHVLLLVYPFRKLVSLAYPQLASRGSINHVKASLDAIGWNLKNLSSTFAARRSVVTGRR